MPGQRQHVSLPEPPLSQDVSPCPVPSPFSSRGRPDLIIGLLFKVVIMCLSYLCRKDCAYRHVLGSLMPGPFLNEASSSCFRGHAFVTLLSSPSLHRAFVTPLSSSSLYHAFVTPSEDTPASPASPERDPRFLPLLLLPPGSLRSSASVSNRGPAAFSLQQPLPVRGLQAPFTAQISR